MLSALQFYSSLSLAVFIELPWWRIYFIAWVSAAPAVPLSLLVLWGAPQWLDFDRPQWLWNVVSLVLLTAGPVGVLWVTLAVTPSGFLGRGHAYGTAEYLAYLWGPGLSTLPPMTLAAMFGWRGWSSGKPGEKR